MKDICFITLW